MSDAPLPPLEWPSRPDAAARSAWYRAIIAAYAELRDGHITQPKIAPVLERPWLRSKRAWATACRSRCAPITENSVR